jgi:hypothetical protein
MKFQKQILFNGIPEWKEDHIDYAKLKRLICAEEAARLAAGKHAGEGRLGAFSHFGSSIPVLPSSVLTTHAGSACVSLLNSSYPSIDLIYI